MITGGGGGGGHLMYPLKGLKNAIKQKKI